MNISHHVLNNTTEIVGAYNYFREQDIFCDIILEVITSGNTVRKIPAHKLVLAAASPYFRDVFTTEDKKKIQKAILIKDVEPDILEAVVAYAYGEEYFLQKNRIVPILDAANKFQMVSLRRECCAFLQRNIQPSNCFGLRDLAKMYNLPNLNRACTRYALDNFLDVIECSEYLSLSLEELIDLISKDEIGVKCEEKIYSAALLWVYHHIDTRKENFPQIMSHIRLPFVSKEFLSETVKKEPLVKNDKQCQKYLQEAYNLNHSLDNCLLEENNIRFKPRKHFRIGNIILTVGGIVMADVAGWDVASYVEQYDPSADKWTIKDEMESSECRLCACFHGGYMYIIGGNCNRVYKGLERYDILENKWTTMMPMNIPRRDHSVCILHGYIYVTGGLHYGETLSNVERYSPYANFWVELKDMNSPRRGHGMASIKGYAFAVGGNSRNTVEMYDPAQDSWVNVQPMSFQRYGCGVATLGDTIYAVGGMDSNGQILNSVERYSIDKNQWESCTQTTFRRGNVSLVAHEGCLYACGGYDGQFLDTVEKYDPCSQSWTPCASMCKPKVYFGIISTHF